VVKIVAKPEYFCTFKHFKKPKSLALQGIPLFFQNHKNSLQQRPKASALPVALHPVVSFAGPVGKFRPDTGA